MKKFYFENEKRKVYDCYFTNVFNTDLFMFSFGGWNYTRGTDIVDSVDQPGLPHFHSGSRQ